MKKPMLPKALSKLLSLILLAALADLATLAPGCKRESPEAASVKKPDAKGAVARPEELKLIKRLVDGDDWVSLDSLEGRVGAPAFVIDGPPLPESLSVPFWLDPKGWYDTFKCLDALQFDFFVTSPGKIYLMQHSPNCGGSECRIYSVETMAFTNPKNCLMGPTGGRFVVQALEGSLYFVYGYQEGPGAGEVVDWTPQEGTKRTLLSHITSPHFFEHKDGAYIIHSNCDPSTGIVPAQKSVPDCQFTAKCDYCANMHGKDFTWRWRPGSSPVRIADPKSKEATESTRGVDELIDVLEDPGASVTARTQAVSDLALLGAPAVQALAALLASPKPEVRARASQALAGMPRGVAGPAREVLEARLSDSDPRVRWNAAAALGNIGPEALPALKRALKRLDHDEEDMWEALTKAIESVKVSP